MHADEISRASGSIDQQAGVSGTWTVTGGGDAGALMRSLDWSSSPVGPMADWPTSLRVQVQTVLRSRHPMFLWWGPELTQFYNDAYIPSFGQGKHPSAMGQGGRECWKEIWPIIGPQIDDVMTSGHTVNELARVLKQAGVESIEVWVIARAGH